VNISPELNQKWMHLKSEHEDIKLLRAKLERAQERAQKLSDEIKQMCETGPKTSTATESPILRTTI
jgi:hypothetical protein